jgi:hypothetical protein
MDTVRGAALPIVVLLMALALAYLGHASTGQARLLAVMSQEAGTPDPAGVAPRAEAEARRRMILKRSREANTQGLALYGGAAFLLALEGLMLLGRLRAMRAGSWGAGGSEPDENHGPDARRA